MRSLASADPSQAQPRFRIPQDLPASISRHVIPVTEPEDIFTDFQSRRERNYHLLIRRFIYQVLYGCTNTACTTPTCLSYQKRTTKTPLRKLTPLSARTIACYLASESNPEAALCPHCPQVFPEHEPSPAVKRRPRRKSHNVTFESSEKGDDDVAARKITENGHLVSSDTKRSRPGVLVKSTRHASDLKDQREHIRTQHDDERWEKAIMRNQSDEEPARDPKSFTQSLFETLPLRMLEWLPFQPRRVNENDSQTQSSPQRCTPEHEITTTTSLKKFRRTPTQCLSQNHPSLVEQKPLRRISSDGTTRASGKAHQMLPNGDARHFQTGESTLRPGHESRANGFEAEKREPTPEKLGPTAGTEALPAAVSFYDQRTLSPPLASESGQVLKIETASQKQNGRNSNDGRHLPPSPSDGDHEPPPNDRPTREDSVGLDSNSIAATYTLQQIPWQTFTDLGVIQEKLERQCLGYQRTTWIPWPDDPKPHEHLALRFSDWSDFVKQCCFYLLKDSSRLARAFKWKPELDDIESIDTTTWPTSISPFGGYQLFTALYRLRPSEEILQFLSYSLDQVFLSASELTRPLRSRTNSHQIQKRVRSSAQSVDQNAPGLSNIQAAFICAVMLYGLYRFAAVEHPCCWQGHADLCWRIFCRLRSTGRTLPVDLVATLEDEYGIDVEIKSDCHFAHLQSLADVFESEIALELVSKLAKAISNRVTFSEVSKTRGKQESSKKRESVLQLLMQHLKDFASRDFWPEQRQRPPSMSSITLEWLRTVVLRDWDGQPIVRRAGAVGGALQMLAAMYEHRIDLRLDEDAFHTRFFAQRLDSMEMPVEWLSYRPDNRTFHLLSHSFLFPPSALVTYFRALNFAAMSKSFETALITARHVSQFAGSGVIKVANGVGLLTAMRPAMARFLVLNVRRDSVVTDAMNQIWRRQKRELMRPLKVRMGMDEGEEGVDHGGVQQEFFRCLFAEALDPAHGMFTIDERTRTTWLQPCSLEPLYKFEMLGILFSIAVYNSITLPVTFPLAFYRKLLDLHVKNLNHIQDGWPDLAKGLQELLDWSEGDVGDIFLRTYEFSFDAFGKRIDVDMQTVSRDDPWPTPNLQNRANQEDTSNQTPLGSETEDADNERVLERTRESGKNRRPDTFPPPSTSSTTTSEAPLVTNINRKQFVKDYIFWLTNKSIAPQYEAFARGFYTCLDRTALSIFNPSALKSVIEGSQHIDIDELESITKYEDGFSVDTPTIRNFWDVVRGFTDEKKRGLLEFVTASDRVPVNGLGSIVFVIQRNGFDDRRLPTSMTCFGRLLLPQYSGREVLESKLNKAIENAKGFGVA